MNLPAQAAHLEVLEDRCGALVSDAGALDLGVQRTRVGAQWQRERRQGGTRAITADTAVRLGLGLGLAFDIEPQFWLNLQAQYDIEAIQRDRGERLAEEVHPLAAP